MRRLKTIAQMHEREARLRALACDTPTCVLPGTGVSRAMEALEAMRRIKEGTYGLCADCSGRIPAARLAAKPEATRCLKCQLERERETAA